MVSAETHPSGCVGGRLAGSADGRLAGLAEGHGAAEGLVSGLTGYEAFELLDQADHLQASDRAAGAPCSGSAAVGVGVSVVAAAGLSGAVAGVLGPAVGRR